MPHKWPRTQRQRLFFLQRVGPLSCITGGIAYLGLAGEIVRGEKKLAKEAAR